MLKLAFSKGFTILNSTNTLVAAGSIPREKIKEIYHIIVQYYCNALEHGTSVMFLKSTRLGEILLMYTF